MPWWSPTAEISPIFRNQLSGLQGLHFAFSATSRPLAATPDPSSTRSVASMSISAGTRPARWSYAPGGRQVGEDVQLVANDQCTAGGGFRTGDAVVHSPFSVDVTKSGTPVFNIIRGTFLTKLAHFPPQRRPKYGKRRFSGGENHAGADGRALGDQWIMSPIGRFRRRSRTLLAL